MVTRRAQVLQARMAIRAQHVIRLDGISAIGAIAVFHQFALFQGKLQILLFTVGLQKRRTRATEHHALPRKWRARR